MIKTIVSEYGQLGTLSLCLELTTAMQKDFLGFSHCSQRILPKCYNFSVNLNIGKKILFGLFSGQNDQIDKIIFHLV